MKSLVTVFKTWFAYASAITLVCGIVYITVQQSYSMSANDPQFQIAEDAANALSKGADPKTLVGPAPIEISQSLAAYLVIYDSSGNMIASGASLDGSPLKIPKGVVDYVTKNGKDAATWQPEPGVRQAMVGIRSSAGKGYIAFAGRSLRMVEEHIKILGEQVAFGWFLSLIGMAVVLFLINAIIPKPALS